MAVRAVPDGHRAVTPYLIVKDAAGALDFYKRAFGAEETMRFAGPDGKIGHAEITIAGAPVMPADEFPEMGFRGPRSLGGSSVGLHVYVEDVDARFDRAVAAGAKALRPVKDQF